MRTLTDALARSDADPLMKPFAALALAALACQTGAASGEYMRGRLAAAATAVVQAIDPRLTIAWTSTDTQTH